MIADDIMQGDSTIITLDAETGRKPMKAYMTRQSPFRGGAPFHLSVQFGGSTSFFAASAALRELADALDARHEVDARARVRLGDK